MRFCVLGANLFLNWKTVVLVWHECQCQAGPAQCYVLEVGGATARSGTAADDNDRDRTVSTFTLSMSSDINIHLELELRPVIIITVIRIQLP